MIRLTPAGQVEVVQYRVPTTGRDEQNSGIAVWSTGGPEQWAVLPGNLIAPHPPAGLASAALRSATRGGGSASSAGPEGMTFQPEQLLGQVVTRAASFTFVTPVDQGFLLEGKITLRRKPDAGTEKFPAAEIALRRGNQNLFTIPFSAGQTEVSWNEIPKLPTDLKNGLPPGAYTLRTGNGPVTSFVVVEREVHDTVLAPLQRLAVVAGIDSPAYLLATAQHLSCQPDADGELCTYAADALDRFDAAAKQKPALAKEAWFSSLRARMLKKLTETDAKPNSDVAATGIEIIDAARNSIQEGNWEAALQTLADPQAEATPRSQALALLYRGVIAAEAGGASLDSPDGLYQEAIQRLQGGEASDLFRAHNNYGNMLFARARDQVHNHAFQMASGSPAPILRALHDWSGAQASYEQALVHAEKLEPSLAAGVRINLAGLYSLLADLIRVLDYANDGNRQFTAGENAATKAAAALAEQVVSQAKSLDPITIAAAQESLAQLAFRASDSKRANEHAEQALLAYATAESLTGIEGAERLLGQIAARPSGNNVPLSAEQASRALRHLQTSHFLTEILRERIPADRAGRSRAGFFARRGYVNERIIDLLLARGDSAAALAIAEGAKSRSLQDVLTQRNVATPTTSGRELAALLADWPKDTAAVEYFLGTERAWGFVVNPQGKVQAWQLADADGKPLASREIVRRVQQLLTDFEGQANKMFRRASSGNGFDHSWQDELNRFGNELLPAKVRDEFKSARHVVLVPHHVLNYFPFAALVTQVDPTARGKLEMPQPRFLIYEPYSISRAPSLAAWDVLRQRAGTFADVRAVGIVEFEQADPLPGVEQDLKNLNEAFGSRIKQLVIGQDASEKNIREALRHPGMIFVGTHGQNIAEEPLLSYLLCHGDRDDDGHLTAGELFGGEVNSSLVVMSACYSGLADRSPLPGDDLFGLERAFLTAGASTVVSGLWDVYDGTGPTLMKSFMTELVAGKSAAGALADSQRSFLAERRKEGPGDPWIHPYFWAVYTVSGNDLLALERSAQ
ncbi:CHAT domain-containing protein [Anatilimnocola aggregata]|uniref:CHAT domain-containing protein n=1 Tax=Anatilimnocola aggregata TaxID=2528021 RepID=UPI00192E59F9|nr:CHAT domain-containing protein [Anatilimnocola aggregata]